MTTKRFLRLQLIIVLMFTFTIISNTFSWAARPAVKGGGFMSETNVDGGTAITNDKTYFTAMELVTPANGYHVNGNSCTAVTYMAAKDPETGEIMRDSSGNIVYDETTSYDSYTIDDFEPDSFLHFKTIITNPSEVVTHTSLYISLKYFYPNPDNTAYEGVRENYAINYDAGIISPITKHNTIYQGEYDTTEEVYKPQWCPILTKIEVSANSTEYVEWYIYNRHKIPSELEITGIYFTNN